MPKVTIYNQTKKSYDVWIKNADHLHCYNRYYHVKGNEITQYQQGHFPERKNPIQKEWEELDINVRMFHFHTVFPRGTARKEFIGYVFGKNAEEILRFEEWLDHQNYMHPSIAWEVYRRIGKFDRPPKIVTKSRYINIYLIKQTGKSWFLTVNNKKGKSFFLETEEQYKQNNYGKIKRISKEMGIPYDIVSIVKLIREEEEMIQVLNRLKDLRSNHKIIERFKRYAYYSDKKMEQAANIEMKAIKKELEKLFGKKFTQMDLGVSKFRKLAKYLLENS